MEDLQMYNFSVKSIIQDYDVSFTDDFGKSLKETLIEGDVIIIDRKVYNLYQKTLEPALHGFRQILIDAVEDRKSYEGIIPIINDLIEKGFRKNHRLIAIGGGITQDVTAFTASIMYRGVSWIFFPTTLLAQADSCIGSKTSINFRKYKNQIGGFYPPRHIFIDLAFLDTLEYLDMKSGLGEMSHYFVVSGKEDFNRFKSEYPQALKDKNILTGLINRSLEIKKSYIEIDEFDTKERRVFNYGHSFGHAIEALTKYEIPHGIAVSYGMDMANFVSVKLGYINEDLRMHIRELLQQVWEGTSIKDINLEEFKKALSKDKKNVGTELRLILNKGLGNIFQDKMQMDDRFTVWLKEYFDTQL